MQFNPSKVHVPWGDIPKKSIFPSVNGVFTIKRVQPDVSKRSGMAMIVITFECSEPKQFKTMQLKNYYVIGTAEDPLCDEDVSTGTQGWRGLQQIRLAAKIEENMSNLGEFINYLETAQCQIGITLLEVTDKDTGEPDNMIARDGYWPVGAKTPEVLPDRQQGPNRGKRPAQKQKQSRPMQTPPRRSRPTAPPKPGSGKPTETEPETAPWEDGPGSGVDAAHVGPPDMLDCPKCKEKVPAPLFSQHVRECTG